MLNFAENVLAALMDSINVRPKCGVGTWLHASPGNKIHGANMGPPGSCRPQMAPMLAPWTLLSGRVRRGDLDGGYGTICPIVTRNRYGIVKTTKITKVIHKETYQSQIVVQHMGLGVCVSNSMIVSYNFQTYYIEE